MRRIVDRWGGARAPVAWGPGRRVAGRRRRPRPLVVERLEGRELLAAWVEQGPGPIINGQTAGLPNNPVAGGVQALAVDPANANAIVAAAVNGGIWSTANVNNANPWTPRTDTMPSLSMGSIARDPLNTSVLYAGTGLFSNGADNINFTPVGGPSVGVYKSTDGGTTWTQVGQADLGGLGLNSMLVSDNEGRPVVFTATTDGGAARSGLYMSFDDGASWQRLSGSNGLPAAGVTSIARDPTDGLHLFVGVPGQGVYQSLNGGSSWTQINGTGGNTLIGVGATTRIVLSVSAAGTHPIYAGLIAGGAPTGIFRSADSGTNWSNMGAPASNPGGQAQTNFSIAADPGSTTRVFIGGDRQAASPFVGNLFVGDSTTNTFTSIVLAGANGTAPHADSRALVFDVAGSLVEADDAGIYRLTNPNDPATRAWTPLDFNIRPTEFYGIAYDNINQKVVGGAQDVGAEDQSASGSPDRFVWRETLQGDGIGAAVDNVSVPNQSIHYTANNGLANLSVEVIDNTNTRVDGQMFAGLNIPAAFGITNASNATPIRITSAVNHLLHTGDRVVIAGVAGNTNANGTFFIVVVNATQFDLYNDAMFTMPQPGNGAYAGGGTWTLGTLNNDMSGGFFPAFVTDAVRDPASNGRLLFGTQSLYESTDRGNTLTRLPSASNQGRIISIAYGGRLNATDLPEVAYVVTDQNRILLRTAAGDNFNQLVNYPGAQPRDLTIDPQNYRRVYVLAGDGRVWASFNAGVRWVEITGDLGAISDNNTPNSPTRKTIAFISPDTNIAHNILMVGGFGAVYATPYPAITGTIPHWSVLGTGLAMVQVMDMLWNPRFNRVVIGTFGRGAWTLETPNDPFPPPTPGGLGPLASAQSEPPPGPKATPPGPVVNVTTSEVDVAPVAVAIPGSRGVALASRPAPGTEAPAVGSLRFSRLADFDPDDAYLL
jgi:hypothetical protein